MLGSSLSPQLLAQQHQRPLSMLLRRKEKAISSKFYFFGLRGTGLMLTSLREEASGLTQWRRQVCLEIPQ